MAGLVLAMLLVAMGRPAAWAEPPRVVKATHSVELQDPAGDVKARRVMGTTYPALDVVKLSIVSDGTKLTVTVTLKDAPGAYAANAVGINIDSDNNPKTGWVTGDDDEGDDPAETRNGFDYKAKLSACVDYDDYDNHLSSCGGASGKKATGHWAAVDLQRLSMPGGEMTQDTVVDSMGMGGRASRHTPITGTVVSGAFDYADLKVKPGQTIRLLIREEGGEVDMADAEFPMVVLTLK
jgi:hypothetical protein